MLNWLDQYSGALSVSATLVSALASAIIVWLTWSLGRFTKAQARSAEESVKVTAALKEIEQQRDAAVDPRVYIWFDGYDPRTGIASFVMQNSGQKSLFLRSLIVQASGMDVELFDLDRGPKRNVTLVPSNEIRDLVVTPERTEKVHLKFKNGWGHHFDLIAQLYVGPPVRFTINPGQLNGYELRATKSVQLVASTELSY